jgi:1-pyrroline-5-carboxylate dehydrogenase
VLGAIHLFVYENWKEHGLEDKLKTMAKARNLEDLTVGPVLTVTTEQFMDHTN